MAAVVESDDRPPATRRVYGRGLFDGLRMAGIDNPGEFLSAAKLERFERELTGIIKKVYDAVPANHGWTATQVGQEMGRLTGSRPEHRAITACLSQLVDRGLVKEPMRGMFLRAHTMKPKLAAVPVDEPSEPSEAVKALPTDPEVAMPDTKSADPMERMAQTSAALRVLAEQATALAKQLDDIAIDVEERTQRIHADTEKLRQLQALLKSIGQ